jgi:hypothetical protein
MSGKSTKPFSTNRSGSVSVGSTRGIGSNASGGGSRDEERRAQHGHTWEGWKHRQAREAEINQQFGQQVSAMFSMGGGMMGGGSMFSSGLFEHLSEQRLSQIEEAAQDASMLDVLFQETQTTLEDFDPAILENLGEDTILRFAFSPEDMAALDLDGEHDAIAEVRNVLTVNNPTKGLMEHLVKSGQFQDVVWSGHGSDEGMWITNEEGQSELMPAEEMAAMFADSSVREMLLNVCDGGKEVDDALNAVGIDTFAYMRDIRDEEAIDDAVEFAEGGSLDNVNGLGGVHRRAGEAAAGAAAEASVNAALPFFHPLSLRGGFGVGLEPTPTQQAPNNSLADVARTVHDSGTAHQAVERDPAPLAGPARGGVRYSGGGGRMQMR